MNQGGRERGKQLEAAVVYRVVVEQRRRIRPRLGLGLVVAHARAAAGLQIAVEKGETA